MKKPVKIIRVRNCVPSRETDQDWTFNNAVGASMVKARATLPQTVDLRESWWKINNQGQTGSCVGWAAADSLLRWHLVKKGVLKKSSLLSVRFVWMSAKETDEFTNAPSTFLEDAGTSIKSALDVLRKYGCVTDALLPFNSGSLFQGPEKTFYAKAAKFKIAAYFNLIRSNQDRIKSWKQWLADGKGPIIIRVDTDATWDNALETRGNLDVYDTASAEGGHAVSIVGYLNDRFIIRNSWGTDLWGDKGFGYASFGYVQDAVKEAYGVSVS